MMYLAQTAHLQFVGLMIGFIAWILTTATTGLNEWRIWHVDNVSVVTSGMAWVGIWRVCFYSHVVGSHSQLPTTEFCHGIGISDHFVPVEIPVAQVLMMLAVICGLAGNILAVVAMRMAYFSVEDRSHIKLIFPLAGTLYVLTAMCSLVPLLWNMSSVMTNSTIDFPPEFLLPAAPVSQEVGSAIGLGILASSLIIIGGLLFLCYPCTTQDLRVSRDPLRGAWAVTTLSQKPELPDENNRGNKGSNNPSFYDDEDKL
ncbi:hypothetical protein LDENG_00010620 [Lucifuga dentata]|nr:hypothetical protein LDENG_00010620 [Lucifuga dentata]